MKHINWPIFAIGIGILLVTSCGPGPEPCEIDPSSCEDRPVVGQRGNPQFNLQFTNETQVDLDLYVEDPNGNVIYYGNAASSSGGQLDIDCQCEACPNGPNENIFWPTDGSAPRGTYRFWISHYGSCGFSDASSSYTVRVLENGRVADTYTGSLSSGRSTVWTYTF